MNPEPEPGNSLVPMLSKPLAWVALLAMVAGARADIYMHNPAGGNNRNREQNDNRNNANRLFDSQNNGAVRAMHSRLHGRTSGA